MPNVLFGGEGLQFDLSLNFDWISLLRASSFCTSTSISLALRFMKSMILWLMLASTLSLLSLLKNSISSSLLWNSLKSNRICDLSGGPGVGQNVSPFSSALIWFSSKVVLERLMTVCPI